MNIYVKGRTLVVFSNTNDTDQLQHSLHPHDIGLQVSWSFPAEGMFVRRITKPVVKLLYLCVIELCFLKTVFS